MREYRFLPEWELNTSVAWWNKARHGLNVIIAHYNNWQIDGFEPQEVERLQARIEWGLQTIGSLEGGEGYKEQLEGMRAFVDKVTSQ